MSLPQETLHCCLSDAVSLGVNTCIDDLMHVRCLQTACRIRHLPARALRQLEGVSGERQEDHGGAVRGAIEAYVSCAIGRRVVGPPGRDGRSLGYMKYYLYWHDDQLRCCRRFNVDSG